MADQQRLNRIDDTLTQLFDSLLPFDPSSLEDPETIEWVDSIISSAKTSVLAADGDLPVEVNSAQDLIKRKLLRENASPEKAARFSNLYSRLLSMPVLNQKWRILYLLYRISDDSVPQRNIRSPLAEVEQPRISREKMRNRYPEKPDSEYNAVHDRRFSAELRSLPGSPAKGRFQRRPVTQDSESSSIVKEAVNKDSTATSEPRMLSKPCPTEIDLLRDLPFNLQGLSSANMEFTSATTIRLPAALPIPILSLLHTLAEPCLLYKGLAEYINAKDGGLIHQSLRAAFSNELRSYLGLVATLESEIRRALAAIEKGTDDQRSVRVAGVTLKRCVVWTRDATMGLRLMSLMMEDAKSKRGGQIISLIHGLLSSHGDPFVAGFAERLLAAVARPFYDILRHWIYDGELVDPYHEFFVVEADPDAKADIDPRRVATSIWEDKYSLETDLVPTIVSADFAKKIFLIGKSLNFIRHNCGDSDWVIQYSQTHSKPLDYANTSNLSSSIDTAYQTTMSRLTFLMSNKFLLFTHLRAMKQYLLLSQGDFIELLVESLAPNLDRPAHSQYRHTLTSQLEHAIRHSNAQYDNPEVLRRLDARMVELGRSETGWDVFTLEYKISPPCDVVITQWANTQYLKIFNLLLRVKRVEYSLNATWRRCMTGARGVLAAVDDKLSGDWKKVRCVIAEMVHFVNQLQYYILFEVVESSWETLQEAITKPDATLDDLIGAHTKYITTITQKGLLGSSAGREDGFLVQLHNMLKCMLNYREVVESLYSFSVAEYTKRQQFSAKIEQRTAAGKWGITDKDYNSRASTPAVLKNDKHPLISDDADSPVLLPSTGGNDQTLLASLRSRLLQLTTEFQSGINVFLYDLAHQPDVDLRFLGVVMNFNEVYKPVNLRRQQRRARRDAEAGRKSRELSSNTSALPASLATESSRME